MSKAREVKALLMAMSMLPSHAPSMRSKASRFPPSSTTAMFIGWPISEAFFSAAAITLRARSRVIMYRSGRAADKTVALSRASVSLRKRALHRMLSESRQLRGHRRRCLAHSLVQRFPLQRLLAGREIVRASIFVAGRLHPGVPIIHGQQQFAINQIAHVHRAV